mmetsp:Transcript_73201/g.107430  ORF Transcript_73201/g.107430 Transcript_73201/m.107430 type:complete len:260 (+) Transcript_73201:10-789(+)
MICTRAHKAVMFGLWGVAVPPARMPSKHEARWEHRKMLPAGCLRAQSLVQGAAIARVLDGEIGTVEGGSLLFHELMEEGIEISPELTPMNLSGQIRRMQETSRVHPEIAAYIQALRAQSHLQHDALNLPRSTDRQIKTLLLCEQWHPQQCTRVGCGCGCLRCRREDAPTPAMSRAKSQMQSHFDFIVESKTQAHDRLDPLLYQSICQLSGVIPQELIYVDRRLEFLKAAASIGITTIFSSSPSHTVQSLECVLPTAAHR